MINLTILKEVKTYSKAFIEVSIAKGVEKDFVVDMKKLKDFFVIISDKKHPLYNYSQILSAVDGERQSKALNAIKSDLALSSFTQSVLTLLLLSKKISLLKYISLNFFEIYNAYHNKTRVKVTSAMILSDAQKEKIEALALSQASKGYHITYEIDPQILGGIIIQIADKLYDNSLINKINHVQSSLKGN